jgi:hypothetical protein
LGSHCHRTTRQSRLPVRGVADGARCGGITVRRPFALLVCLWFVFDDNRFWFNSHPTSPLVAATGRDVDLAVLVDQFDPPDLIRQVRVRGPGRVEIHDPARVQQIHERYLGSDVSRWPDFFRERINDDTWTLWSVSPHRGVATMYPDFREESTRWECFAESPFASP